MKIDKQTILIIALSIVVLVGGFVLLNKDTPQPEPEITLGATGSKFRLETQWVQASTTIADDNAITEITSTSVASTTTFFLTAAASTTVEIVTAGVADIRFNIQANSTTTSPTLVTTRRHVIGNNAIDAYPISTITSGDVSPTPYAVWSAATTSDSTLIDGDLPKTSFLFENIDTPITKFTFGVSTDLDLFIEVVKAVPN